MDLWVRMNSFVRIDLDIDIFTHATFLS